MWKLPLFQFPDYTMYNESNDQAGKEGSKQVAEEKEHQAAESNYCKEDNAFLIR